MSLTLVSQIGDIPGIVSNADDKTLEDAVNAYLQKWTVEWLAAKPGRTNVELGGLTGLTDAQITTLKKHGRGAGTKTVRGYAKLLGITRDELEARALAAFKAAGGDAPKPDIRTEYDERYPNRRLALAGVQAAQIKLHPKTLPTITSRAYHSKVDPSPEDWLKKILELNDKLRAADANPARAAEQRAELQAQLDAMIESENAKSTALAADIPGLEGPESLGPAPPKTPRKKPRG